MTFQKVEIMMKMLQEDQGTPRSVREKLNYMMNYLKGKDDASTKVSTCLGILEELSQDVNIPAYVRNQLFSISATLEQIGF
jgi:uncharacterized protein (UPF0147 family)